MITFVARPETIKQAIKANSGVKKYSGGLKISGRAIMKMNQPVGLILKDVLADLEKGNYASIRRRVIKLQNKHSIDSE